MFYLKCAAYHNEKEIENILYEVPFLALNAIKTWKAVDTQYNVCDMHVYLFYSIVLHSNDTIIVNTKMSHAVHHVIIIILTDT